MSYAREKAGKDGFDWTLNDSQQLSVSLLDVLFIIIECRNACKAIMDLESSDQ